jgi:hypothetical protein
LMNQFARRCAVQPGSSCGSLAPKNFFLGSRWAWELSSERALFLGQVS